MRKPDIEYRLLIKADPYPSAQSDQSLHYPHEISLSLPLFTELSIQVIKTCHLKDMFSCAIYIGNPYMGKSLSICDL